MVLEEVASRVFGLWEVEKRIERCQEVLQILMAVPIRVETRPRVSTPKWTLARRGRGAGGARQGINNNLAGKTP